MRQIFSITRKELDSYFGSPMALIFLGAFLAVALFTFFWAEPFWARGIADVRPLFSWMPLLLIFLVAALTMRQWSEEQRSGTLEMLLTLPVKAWQLALGKFLAVMTLVALALTLTLPVPITVALLGPLDWGPVIGGYLAALLLAAAYTAIGLFISSRTDNQIVALIATALLGGIIYLVGTRSVTEFVGNPLSTLLRNLGTGARFESIERGIIDLRDLAYYLSITLFFLALNVLSLESKRWSHGTATASGRRNAVIFATLAGINLLLLNVWLSQLYNLRVDLTQQQEYSLSPTTKTLLGNLQEPLLIRGYISEKSHPLLNPLRPRIEDLLREYVIAGGGKVTGEVLDPAKDPAVEQEANQSYNIRATPFQVQDRYQNAIVNSYFDILVRYGDQDVTLSFRDLIEVEPKADGTVNVRLRNLEYDLTSAIKKVVFGFQSVESVLAAISEPVQLTLYRTAPDKLPDQLKEVPANIEKAAKAIADKSNGKLQFTAIDPDDPASGVTRQKLLDDFGMQPFALSLFSNQSYYLHMVLKNGKTTQLLYPPNDPSEGAIKASLETALKRSTAGFLKTVGLWTPPATPTQNMFGQQQPPFAAWNNIRAKLAQEYTVKDVDLTNGQAPADVDMLLMVMPQNLTDKERFAIDQYLMRGGSLVVAAGNYRIDLDQMSGGLALQPVENGLRELLASYGVNVEQSVVMDKQNQPFPQMVNRDVNGFQVQEMQALNFPFFVDVRQAGMDRQQPIVGGLQQVALYFASPVTLDEAKNKDRQSSVLLSSSDQSWLRTDTTLNPNPELYPELGYPVEGELKSHPLAVVVQGSFESFFKGKPSPFVAQPPDPNADPNAPPTPVPTGLQADVTALEQSPTSARLVVVGSGEFLDDTLLDLSSRLVQDQVANNLQLAQNAVDWSVEDTDLLSIRARGNNTRLLDPLTERQQTTWEIGNYLVALLILLLTAGLWYIRRRNEQPMQLDEPASLGHPVPVGND